MIKEWLERRISLVSNGAIVISIEMGDSIYQNLLKEIQTTTSFQIDGCGIKYRGIPCRNSPNLDSRSLRLVYAITTRYEEE